MNTLRNPWVVAILAVLFGVGTQAGYFFIKFGGHGDSTRENPVPPPTYAPRTISWNFITPAVGELQAELEQRLAAVTEREKELEKTNQDVTFPSWERILDEELEDEPAIVFANSRLITEVLVRYLKESLESGPIRGGKAPGTAAQKCRGRSLYQPSDRGGGTSCRGRRGSS